MDLVQQLLERVLFHGLTPAFDKKGFRVHNVVIVGAARQPALSLGSQLIWPEFGISQLSGVPILNLFRIGTQANRPK